MKRENNQLKFLIVKQNYVCRKPNYTIYKEESKWFGLKKRYPAFRLYNGFAFASTFDNLDELLGRLVKYHCDKERKFKDFESKEEKNICINFIKENIRIKFIEYSQYLKDKPTYYGEASIKEYYNLKNDKGTDKNN